jgi:hypothetical protein
VVRNEAEGLSPADPNSQVERDGRIGGGSIIHVVSRKPLGTSGFRGRLY